MAVLTYYANPIGDGVRCSRYFLCDTEAELPATALQLGDRAYTKDSKANWVADSASTWASVMPGMHVGSGAPSSGLDWPFYFRTDGGLGSRIYFKVPITGWTGIL